MVPVGSVIISIAVEGEAAAAPVAATHGAAHAASGTTATAAPVASPAAVAGARVQATPAVRQLAKQMGVAIEALAGSGPGGAITADDVKRAVGGATTSATPAAGATAPLAPTAGETRQPLRGLRRKIAEHMRHSLSTAAQFTFVAEVDMTEVVKHRAALKAKAEAAGVKLTYLPYVAKALVEPLRQFPLLNASLDDATHEIVLKPTLHLGFATATAEGLTVPVIHDVASQPLLGLAREIERLAIAARDHKLKLEELQGATFTITSTGAKGGVLATPILHHPQVAILGVHEVKKKPAVVNDQIVIRELGNLSLSMDHRVVDGAVGADFLYAVIARLQDLSWLASEDRA
jgi:pyruvate dehydrogenase E2 component (dihydrolipoamide acetyltransferase)